MGCFTSSTADIEGKVCNGRFGTPRSNVGPKEVRERWEAQLQTLEQAELGKNAVDSNSCKPTANQLVLL